MRISRTISTVLFSLIFSTSIFANGLSLNSVGTKALGMGGAFVGLANDATAIYWNPAGLSGQNSSVLIFATDIIPAASYKYDAYGIDAETKTNHYIGPNIFVNYNMDDLSLGLGLFVPAGLGAEWNGDDLTALGGPAFLDPGQTMQNPFAGKSYKWLSKIGVFSISPSAAYKFSDKFSAGLAVNVYYGMMDMKRAVDAVDITQNPPAGGEDGMVDNQYEEESDGIGYGFTLGLKYDVSDMVSLGLTYRSEAKIAFSGTAKNTGFQAYNAYESKFDRDLSWPMWIGAGVAFRPMEKLVITLDAQFSQWSETEDVITTDYKDQIWDAQIDQQGANKMILHWKDATQIRVGAQYCVSKDLSLRAGYYHDPAPAPDKTVNILFPSSTNHVLTGGLSYKINNITLVLAGEYLMGAERDVDAAEENMPGKHQMDVLAISGGFGFSF